MRKVYLFLLSVLLLCSCMQDLDELEKYTPPPWLKGKLYSQVEAQDELSLFAEALKLTGLDTIINTSGLFTVFAPNNDAFTRYFQDHPSYGGELAAIPLDELREIISYHIIQNSWSMRQLSTLNLNGWIDESQEEVRSRAFKKESILRRSPKEYHVFYDDETGYQISNESTGFSRKVYSLSRKYVPVFFTEYFDTYGLPESDYEYYFGRTFEGPFHFAGAKVLNEEEIPAENGYVYLIDRVVDPLPTAEEFMEGPYDGYGYNQFLQLIYEFPEFTTNLDATYQQEGASAGVNVDTLYNLTFPELEVNISSEITDPSGSNSLGNIQYHNGVFAPTDQAFSVFLDKYVNQPEQWRGLKNVPRPIKKIIVNSYLVNNVVYGSDIAAGFKNAENDMLFLDESNFRQRGFGSNASFIGLDQAIVPRAFSSVSAPVYLRRGFYTYLTAIEETNVLDALKREDQNYSFYVIRDEFSGMLKDSSVNIRLRNNNITFEAYNRSTLRMENLPVNDLRKMILNHVGMSIPRGIASLEFIENLAGNYLVFDHQNGLVSGTAPTVYGFSGDSVIDVEPVLLDEDTDNGMTYEIPTWFKFSSSPMNLILFDINPQFVYLLEDAGMAEQIIGDEYELVFLNQGTAYTAFIPTQEALSKYNTDTLTSGELEQFLLNHFIPNEKIFTDGSTSSGTFQTSNAYSGHQLTLELSPDIISIRDRLGSEISQVEYSSEYANSMTTTRIGNTNSTSSWNFVTNGVVHAIDTVLISNVVY